MKTSFMIFIFLSLLSISEIKSIVYADAGVIKESVWRTDEEVMAIYEEWMAEHGKLYSALRKEKLGRFEIFKDNLRYIEEHNSLPNQTYKLGLNQFSDLTLDEFESIYLSSSPMDDDETTLDESESDFSYLPELNYSLPFPDSVDWRKQGAVLPIRDQGHCGSCWAFSAIASVEAANKLASGDLIPLSEQMLLDCVTSAHGCNGGNPRKAFQYMKDHGIASRDDYPYQAVQGASCQNKITVAKIQDYRNIAPNEERSLEFYTLFRVLSVSIKAKSKDFQHYRSGIFSGKCGDKFSHSVNVVGFDSENDNDYWIVRNSWGEKWGEEGYIRMPRNVENPEGYCGIASRPSFPIMYEEGNISIL